MPPDTLYLLQQWSSVILSLAPLLLLAFKGVRRLLARATAWLWRPVADRFARGERMLQALLEEVGAMRQQMAVVVGTLRLQSDNADDTGFFECDAEGRNTYVNRTYCRWMHCSPDELMDWGFVGFVHPTERESVRSEWAACLRDHRDYRVRVRLGTPQHGYHEYDVVARPIPDSPPALAWAGTVRQAHGQFQ